MNNAASTVLPLGELLQLQPAPKPCLIEPGLLPPGNLKSANRYWLPTWPFVSRLDLPAPGFMSPRPGAC